MANLDLPEYIFYEQQSFWWILFIWVKTQIVAITSLFIVIAVLLFNDLPYFHKWNLRKAQL